MIKIFRLTFITFLAAVLFASCSDSPTSVDPNLVPDGDKIDFVKYDTQELNIEQTSSNFVKLENLYGGDSHIIGQNDYAKSSILFKWNISLDDTLINYIKSGEVTVDTALVIMNINYHLGTKNPIYFTAQELHGEWNSGTLTRDSIRYLTNDGDPNVISSDITYTDSTASFLLDNGLVYNWLKIKADSNLTNNNYGIVLKPTAGTNGFIGFKSTYASNVSIEQTTLDIVLKKSGVTYDTLVAYPYEDLHVVESVGNVPLGSQDKIVLEGGYVLRGKLHFAIQGIPSDVSISKAILQLPVDEASSIDGDPSSDSILVNMYVNSVRDSVTADSNYPGLLKRSGNVFSGDITPIVQQWINGKANEGLRIFLLDEHSTVAKIILYGSKEADLRFDRS